VDEIRLGFFVLGRERNPALNLPIFLLPRPVAEFYTEVMQTLSELGIDVRINDKPNEIPEPVRFIEDYTHASYD
jgi:hypothetical protein